MHHHLFHTMLNDKEMKIMLWIMIEEIVHYYRLNKKKMRLCESKNTQFLPVNLSIHCRTSAGKNP